VSPSLARRLLPALVFALYVSLSFTRQGTAWLDDQGLLQASVVLTLLVGAVFVGWLVASRTQGAPVPFGAVVLAVVCAFALLSSWERPEERTHLAIYGLIGALSWFAGRYRPLLAVLIGGSIGIGDELLQSLIPSRVFDIRDLIANVVIAAAGTSLIAGGRLSWLASVLLGGLSLVLLQLPVTGQGVVPNQEFAAVERRLAPSSTDSADARLQQSTGDRRRTTAPAAYEGANVAFITIDALRADHLSPWGQPPLALPTFAEVEKKSVSFEEVFANGAWTSPGMVSFLTGLHPAVHGVEERGVNFPASATTFLDTLAAAGYATWGFAADGEENYTGLGFQYAMDRSLPPAKMLAKALSAQQGPAFAWLHLRDIHAPYDASSKELEELGLESDLPKSPILDRARSHHTVPRAEFPGRHGWLRGPIRALYAAELSRQDRILGEVLASLSEIQNLIIVVSADHGEELLDHDGIGHASTTLHSAPHPELVRIPLFIKLPDGRGAGEQRKGAFQQVDLMPTLGGLLGLSPQQPVPGLELDGRDLSAAVLGDSAVPAKSTRERPVLVSTSPCGWQCPPDRLHERIHALIQGSSWEFCDPGAEACDASIAERLEDSARRAALLRGSRAGP
jgi:hypothetical protein